MCFSVEMTPAAVLQRGGPFLLPTQPFLTLSPHPVFIPCLLPFPPQRKIALQTLAQKPYSWGKPVWPHPAEFEPFFFEEGQGAVQSLPLWWLQPSGQGQS